MISADFVVDTCWLGISWHGSSDASEEPKTGGTGGLTSL